MHAQWLPVAALDKETKNSEKKL